DGGANESRQLLGARTHLLRVEHSLGKTPEETRRPVLQNVAARAQNGGARSDRLSDADEIILVSTSTVEYDERLAGSRILRGHEAMNESQIVSHALGPCSSSGAWMLGRSASISNLRGSSQSGSFSDRPRETHRPRRGRP